MDIALNEIVRAVVDKWKESKSAETEGG